MVENMFAPSTNNFLDFLSGLDFEKRQISRVSTGGTRFSRMESIGVPRIPSKTLNCVAYLYHNVADAEAGRDFGGTAFFVAVPADHGDRAFVYAVTNWHVAVRDGASVLRVNKKDGGTDIFDFGPEDWEFDPRFDIAVIRLNLNQSHLF
jgi:hypothetical protein